MSSFSRSLLEWLNADGRPSLNKRGVDQVEISPLQIKSQTMEVMKSAPQAEQHCSRCGALVRSRPPHKRAGRSVHSSCLLLPRKKRGGTTFSRGPFVLLQAKAEFARLRLTCAVPRLSTCPSRTS